MATTFLLLFLALLFVASSIALAIWSVVRGETRATQMLDDWLRDNDFQLLGKSTPWVKDNPFFMSSNRSQKVFKVTVRDKTGRVRVGWLRCGHALGGVAVSQVEVKWDEAPQQEQIAARDSILPPP